MHRRIGRTLHPIRRLDDLGPPLRPPFLVVHEDLRRELIRLKLLNIRMRIRATVRRAGVKEAGSCPESGFSCSRAVGCEGIDSNRNLAAQDTNVSAVGLACVAAAGPTDHARSVVKDPIDRRREPLDAPF